MHAMDNLKIVFVISCIAFLGVTPSLGQKMPEATSTNKTELQQKINNLNITISNITKNVEQLKQNATYNFADFKDNAARQYKDLIVAISEMDDILKNFTHKGCNDSEVDFKKNALPLNNTFDRNENKSVELINSTVKTLADYEKTIIGINLTLANCTKNGVDDITCLSEVENQLNKYTNLSHDLEENFKTLEQNITNLERNATGEADGINSKGLNARQCLKNLISAKHDIEVNLIDYRNKIQVAKENLTDQSAKIESYVNNTILQFAKNVNASWNELKKIVNFTEAKHLNSTNCTDDIKLNLTHVIESFLSVINVSKSIIDKQITQASSAIPDMSHYEGYYNETMKNLSKCADDKCFEELANNTSIETNLIYKNFTKYLEMTQGNITLQQKNITEHRRDGEAEFSNITTKSYNCSMQVLKQNASSKIETLGITLNKSLENALTNITNLSAQTNTFCDQIELTFNNTIYHTLLNATTEIEKKESKANNMKLNIKTCTDEHSELNKYVATTIQIFTSNVNQSRTNASDTVEKAIKDIGAFKSFTRESFGELSACVVYDCIDEVVKKWNRTEKDDEIATNLIWNQVNGIVEDIKPKLSSDQKYNLNRTLSEISQKKNRVISCLDEKIRSFSTRSAPNFISICVLLILQSFRWVH